MTKPSFDNVPKWEDRLKFTRNVVRQRLVSKQLKTHLPEVSETPLVVDIGCGQGTQVLALAEQGYDVLGIDPSNSLLETAATELAKRSRAVQGRVSFAKGDLDNLRELVTDPIDILLCHGVLMYLPSLEDSIKQLSECLAVGGTLSVLTRNQRGLAMRAGMSQQWDKAVEGFDSHCYKNNLGIDDVRADTPEEVLAVCKQNGLEIKDWYGVRLFTDHWGDVETADDIEELLKAEEQAGARDPYRQLTSLTHVVARRSTAFKR